jgi:predicted metal-dependent hydrolase
VPSELADSFGKTFYTARISLPGIKKSLPEFTLRFYSRLVQREAGFQMNFPNVVAMGAQLLPVTIARNPRARRYLLRLNKDFTVRLTIPRGGSLSEAQSFLQRNIAWLERSASRLANRPRIPNEWLLGTPILWRGELVPIEGDHCDGAAPSVRFGNQTVRLNQSECTNFRPVIERHIWRLAASELPPVVMAYAEMHGLRVERVSVRSQRSRWGSCSRRGVISLNWRLLQAPVSVRDYLVLHELMHLREMNHSRRFWAHVANACPEYKHAETWLSQHSHLLS